MPSRRSLDDFSDLFLATDPPECEPADAEVTPEPGTPPRRAGRFIAVSAPAQEPINIFLCVNLAIALARSGQAVALADGEREESRLRMGLGRGHSLAWPPGRLSAFGQPKDESVEGPLGIRLYFVGGRSGPGKQDEPEALHRLHEEIPENAFLLANLPLSDRFLRAEAAFDRIVLPVSPEQEDILESYYWLKRLAGKRNGPRPHRPRIGVVITKARSVSQARCTFEKFALTAKRFLGLEVESLGLVPTDIEIIRSILERKPYVLYHPNDPTARSIEEIAGLLIDGLDPAAPAKEGWRDEV